MNQFIIDVVKYLSGLFLFICLRTEILFFFSFLIIQLLIQVWEGDNSNLGWGYVTELQGSL